MLNSSFRRLGSGTLWIVAEHNKSTKPHCKTMKIIHHIILTSFTVLFTAAPSAKAYLYLTGDANFGPNSITVDTTTGLGWLNVSKAAGLSYQQVLADMTLGGTYSGFRFATMQEVVGLYNSAGLTASSYGDTADYYPASSPLIQSFFSLVGTTGTINGLPGIIALSGTSPDGGITYIAPTIYGWSFAQEYWVNDGLDGAAYGSTFSYPDVSSWLVKSVPEPVNADFLVLAAMAWCGFMLLYRREGAVSALR